jgi:two-component system, NtrC family, response regulator GlrR
MGQSGGQASLACDNRGNRGATAAIEVGQVRLRGGCGRQQPSEPGIQGADDHLAPAQSTKLTRHPVRSTLVRAACVLIASSHHGVVPIAPGTRLLTHPGHAPVLVLRPSRLEVTEGPDRGKDVQVQSEALTVGSDARNQLVLTDKAASSRHFEISATSHGRVLRDLGSTNGTFVDGHRVGEIYLGDQAQIRAGESVLQYRVLDAEVQVPLTSRTNFGQLLGHSAGMRAAFAILERAAKTDATVLVVGESGTGKELAARALHDDSSRKDGAYVVFDCGAAAPTLLESQLFGHARGAFTGAVDARAGVFEDANSGTLVLDEIGELPLALQPKLLRALEARTVQRVGENRPRPIDARFIACTNRNLDEEVRAGRFRQDLLFRLSVVVVRLPPLRERKDEIVRLVHHFLTQLHVQDIPELDPSVLDLLQSYHWPGNVRELRNFVERMVVLRDIDPTAVLRSAAAVSPSPSQISPPIHLPFHEAKRQWTEQLEREYLTRLLEAHAGNLSEAARVAGLSRQSCYRLMEKHGLRGS